MATSAAAGVGSLASKREIPTWYAGLRKPGFVPPNAVIPVVWTTIYALIATGSARAIDAMRGPDRRRFIAALGANLTVNAAWSWIFFRLHNLRLASVVSTILFFSSADLARRAGRADRRAGVTLAAYPAWSAFAAALSFGFWRKNP